MSAKKTCPGPFSSITNGRWVATLGPDDQSGSDDDGGFESATSKPYRTASSFLRLFFVCMFVVVIENGPPSGSNFLVFVRISAQPLFDVNATVKYFLNGAEVGSVVLNLDAPSANDNAWGSREVPLDILEMTFNTDPSTFLLT